MCCFSAKHAALRRKSKYWLARNNVPEWGDMSIRRQLFQWTSTIKIELSVLVKYKADLIMISLTINLFSPRYSWKIAELALNSNHSLPPIDQQFVIGGSLPVKYFDSTNYTPVISYFVLVSYNLRGPRQVSLVLKEQLAISEHLISTPDFSEVRVARSLVFCPFVLYPVAIVMYIIRFDTSSDYPFDTFKFFFLCQITNHSAIYLPAKCFLANLFWSLI